MRLTGFWGKGYPIRGVLYKTSSPPETSTHLRHHSDSNMATSYNIFEEKFQISSMDYTFGKNGKLITLTYAMAHKLLKNRGSARLVHLSAEISYCRKSLWQFTFYKHGYNHIEFSANEMNNLSNELSQIREMPFEGVSKVKQHLRIKDTMAMRLFFLTNSGLHFKNLITDFVLNHVDEMSSNLETDIKAVMDSISMDWVRKKSWSERSCYLYEYYYLNNTDLFEYLIILMTPLLIEIIKTRFSDIDTCLIQAAKNSEIAAANELEDYNALLEYENC